MDNKEYWIERQEAIEAKAHKKTDAFMKELASVYRANIAISEQKIEAFISKYAENNMLTLMEAEKVLTGVELKDYRARIKKALTEYKKSGSEVALSDIDRINRQGQITRLQGLINELEVELGVLAQESEELITEHLTDVAQTTYSAVVSTAQVVGMGVAFHKLNKDAVEFILSYKWSGSQFSDRIWDNKNLLIKSLKETLTIGLVQGTSTKKMARELKDKMNSSFKNANRLVRTESNFVLGQSTNQFYKDNDVEMYEYYATEDERTCDKCGVQHEKKFKVEDMRVGVNYHPLHPHCRCTTIPVV